jgi:nicotinamidase-related amidase
MTMNALVVIDMQVGLLDGAPKHDLADVIVRINRLAAGIRQRGGKVVWIQHSGPEGTDFAPGRPAWQFLPELQRADADLVVAKTLNDAFAGSTLQDALQQLGVERVLIAGWATDFCVDATLRSAVSHGYHVVAICDAQTLADRPHLEAASVIRHHTWVWANLITRASILIATTDELLGELHAAK